MCALLVLSYRVIIIITFSSSLIYATILCYDIHLQSQVTESNAIEFTIIRAIRLLDGTRVGNLDFFLWLPRIRPITFNLLHNLNPLGNLSKNSMLPIQPRCLRGTNEELTSIGIGSSIRHAHRSNSTVSNIKVLIIESSPIDTFPPRFIKIRHVTTLAHEPVVEPGVRSTTVMSVGYEDGWWGNTNGLSKVTYPGLTRWLRYPLPKGADVDADVVGR